MTAVRAESFGGAERQEPIVPHYWRHRRRIVRLVIESVLLAGLITMIVPQEWTSSGSFVVEDKSDDAMQSLSSISAKFGVDLSSSSNGASPRFFAALLTSHQVLAVVADQRAPGAAGASTLTVPALLRIKGESPAIRRERTIKYLRSHVVSALFDQRTGITSFSVTTRSAELSRTIATALVSELNRYAAERHQSRASAERKFLEARMAAITQELTGSEDAVAAFLKQNRSYQQSPEQTVEFSRLSRKLSELQGVQSLLSQTFEQARIEEVRDSPVLSTVDDPLLPVLPDKRAVIEWMIATGFLMLLVVLGGLTASRMLGLAPAWLPGEPRTFAECWPLLRSELLRPWRLVF